MDQYIVRKDGRRNYYSDKPTDPSGNMIIKGPGAVFRNKMKLKKCVLLENNVMQARGQTFIETTFTSDGDYATDLLKMEFGLERMPYRGIQWDPTDIMQHPVLGKLRNLERIKIHVNEVVDVLSVGLGEMPKVNIDGLADAQKGGMASSYRQMNSAELTYENVIIEITLRKSL